MSLYDDVDDGKITTNIPIVNSSNSTNSALEKPQANDIANWGSSSSSFKLLEAQLQAKRRQASNVQSSLKRDKVSASIAPVINLSDKRKRPEGLDPTSQFHSLPLSVYHQTTNQFQTATTTTTLTNVEKTRGGTGGGDGDEEYDPLKPNDYEKLAEELKKKKQYKSPQKENDSRITEGGTPRMRQHSERDRRDRSRERDRDRDRERNRDRDRDYNRSRDRSRDRSREKDKERDRERDRNLASRREMRPRYEYDDDDRRETEPVKRATANAGAAFAPPPSLIEEDQKKAAAAQEMHERTDTSLTVKSVFSTGRTLAEKMMEKMGYREGQGLGRNQQGISIPLQVEKIGRRSGRVIHEKDIPKEPVKEASNDVMKNPSKVVLLRNMVGPGEVDGELEGETKEECQKYGEVNKVVIFEIPNTTPDEAVRIFIEFKTLPSAIKSLVDLNGRYFGGRIVKASFYNLDKFKQLNLVDDE